MVISTEVVMRISSKRGTIHTASWHQTRGELLQVLALGFGDAAPHISAFSRTQTRVFLLWDFRISV